MNNEALWGRDPMRRKTRYSRPGQMTAPIWGKGTTSATSMISWGQFVEETDES